MAGGQSLIPLMKLRFAAPETRVDLNRVGGLDTLAADDGGMRIGALVRHSACERSPLLRGRYRLLGDASRLVADPLVRNRGTVCGSLAHADPQGDWGSVMLAARGEVVARGPDGERTIGIDDLITGPFTTTLEPGEVITEARIPDPGPRTSGTYLKLERKVGDFATAAVAVQVTLANGSVGEVGIGLTGVGGTNIRATAAEDALRGAEPTEEAIREAGRLAAEAAEPQADNRGSVEYKRSPRARVHRARPPYRDRGRAGRGGLTMSETTISPATTLHDVTVSVNGTPRSAAVESRLLLVHFLRETLGLTGTHIGCDTTTCGACTVLLDGTPVKSCTMLAVQADGHQLRTVEGLLDGGALHPIQQAFSEKHGLQCGFCTPGMMLTSVALLQENPDPSDDEIRWALSGQICRCTGYQNIVAAVHRAAELGKEG